MKKFIPLLVLSLTLGLGLAFGLFWLLGTPAPAQAAPSDRPVPVPSLQAGSPITRYVSISGDDTNNNCTNPNQPCRTLQQAVGQADSGDWILVTGGEFTDLTGMAGEVVYVNKSLTFQGGYNSDFTARDPEAWPTIVNGEGVRRGFTIIGDEFWGVKPTVSIEGLHIRNGNGNGYGGGLNIYYANVILNDVQVYENVASSTGWGYGGGLRAASCWLSIRSSSFTTNTASTVSGGYGGGLYVGWGCTGEIVSSTIRANIAATASEYNYGYGGGIYLSGNDWVVVSNDISDNIANNGSGYGYGGGLYIEGSRHRLEGNRIVGNRSGGSYGGTGGGIALYGDDHVLTGNLIAQNEAWYGGGIYRTTWGYGTVTLDGNRILSNVAQYGGGGLYVSVGYSALDLTNNVVAGNQASSGTPGIYAYADYNGNIVLRHTTLVGNTGGDGSALYTSVWGGSVVLSNTIIASQTVGIVHYDAAQVSLEATLWDNVDTYILGSVASTGAISITGQARFVDDAYHIAADSDAVDRGVDAGVWLDMDGEFRPSGQGFDIGADEVLFPISMGLLPAEQWAWAEAGQAVVFTHTLRNTGAQADTYTLTASILSEPPAGWGLDWAPGPAVALNPGQQATIWITVTAPGGASLNDWSIVNLTATSSISPTEVWRVVTDTVVINSPATRYVATTGSDVRGPVPSVCANPASPCRTVQHAVDIAFAGDEVRIAEGVYTGTGDAVISLDKGLSLLGGYNADFTQRDPDASATILDGENARRGIYINGSFQVTVDGFRITRGNASSVRLSPRYGGGIYVNGATLILSDTRVYSNVASIGDGYGGGIYAYNATLTIRGSQFYSNIAGRYYGYGYGGGLYAYNTALTIGDSQFYNNVASTGYYGSGGGMYLSDCRNSVISSSVFQDNWAGTSEGNGGGIYISGGTRITVKENQFIQNVAGQWGWWASGGGMYASSQRLVVERNTFLSNTATLNGTSGYGGGLYISYNDPVVRHNLFQGNVANASNQGHGGALALYNVWDAQIEANTVVSNTASGSASATGRGGGLWIEYSQRVNLDNNIIAANRAGGSNEGSGIYLWNTTDLSSRHTTLADNVLNGVYLDGSSRAGFMNTIIAGHATVGITATAESNVSLDYTLWYGNGVDSGGPGTIDRTHDLSGDPRFVNPAGLDYHIGTDSQARDQAPCTDLLTDIDGDLRPAGSACDVGADEYPWVFSLEPDRSGAVRPGETVFYTHTLQNTGGRLDTYALASSMMDEGWTVNVIPASVPVPPGYEAIVVTAVSAPATAISGTQATALITATSQGSGLTDSVTDVTTVLYRPGAPSLTPTLQRQDARPLETVIFTHTLTNRSNSAETFAITGSIPASGWEAPIVTPSEVTVPAYGSAVITVEVQVPANAPSGTLGVVLVQAVAVGDPSLYDESADVVGVLQQAGIAFAPDRAGTVKPGETVTYTHILTNTGNGPDTFSLALGGLPVGWSGSVAPTSISLAAGASAPVTVTVQAPTGALSGTVATAVVTATSSADPAVQATVSDQTTVLQRAGVALAPDREGTVLPGETVTYTHILTNTGNGPDTFSLALGGLPAGWSGSVAPTSISLAAGASAPVTVTVQAPTGALSGTVATAVVTATSSADPSVWARVTDRTTVQVARYYIYLPLVLRNYGP